MAEISDDEFERRDLTEKKYWGESLRCFIGKL
jgi:hypothetical protein